jgi:hypothetical protein
MLISTSGYSVGKTAVIALTFPAGGINTGMGECGVSLGDNIYSVYSNPASLPAIGSKNMAQLLYSGFHEDLLPSFQIKDLYHNAFYSALILNDLYRFIDFGYAFGKKHVGMGQNEIVNLSGTDTISVNSYEDVTSNAFAVRLFKIASIGINLKNFTSALAPGIGPGDEGVGKGTVFDLGLRLEYNHEFFDCLSIHPAVGLTFLNYGQKSVYYVTEEYSDPLPRKRLYGGSLDINFANFFGVTVAKEREYAVVDNEKIEHLGLKIDITPFYSIIKGHLIDPAGVRDQGMNGYVLTFNFYNTLLCVQKIVNLIKSSPEDIRFIKLAQPLHWMKLNAFYQQSHNEITSYINDNGGRDGQKRDDYSFGINVICTPFSAWIKK